MDVNPEYNSYYRSDDEIFEDVRDRLGVDPRIDLTDIEIVVKKGVVTLRGEAESAEEVEMAEALAQRIEGVIDVVNELYVVGAGHSQAPWPGKDAAQEEELEDVEVLPGEREATENYIEAVDEGIPYIPPDAPEFSDERDSARKLARDEAAEQRSRSRRKLRKGQSDKVEGQEL